MAVQVALINARIERENRKDEIWPWATVHTNRNRRCVLGASHWQKERRSLGPAAEM